MNSIPEMLSVVLQVVDLLPKGCSGCSSREEMIILIGTGMELGMSPFQSLRVMSMQRGRVCMSADMLVGLARRAGVCESFLPVEETDDHVVWETTRAGSVPVRRAYSLEDAKRAGLLSRETWRQHPKRMMSARAKAFLARDIYPDVLAGLFSQEEIDEIEETTLVPAKPAKKAAKAELVKEIFSEEDPKTDKHPMVEPMPIQPIQPIQPIPQSTHASEASMKKLEARAEWISRMQSAKTVDDLRRVAALPSEADRPFREDAYKHYKSLLEEK